jgi:hypothetical protein
MIGAAVLGIIIYLSAVIIGWLSMIVVFVPAPSVDLVSAATTIVQRIVVIDDVFPVLSMLAALAFYLKAWWYFMFFRIAIWGYHQIPGVGGSD